MTDADAVQLTDAGAPTRTGPEPQMGTVVTAHSSSPDRTVFTERGNTEAWIASDLTLDLDL